MSIKTAIGIFAVACLVLVGTFVILFLRPVSSPEDYPTAMETTVSQQITIQNEQQKPGQPYMSQESCAVNEQEKVFSQGIEYEPGLLIVSFPLETNFSQATQIISEYELSPEEGAEGTFTTSHWFHVRVEAGNEFKWLCALKADNRVKYITIDPIIYLNQ